MIKINGISKTFSKKKVLTDVTLKIEKGECLSIIGPNGAGKSTIINCTLGLLDVDEGEIIINNLNYNSNYEIIRKITGCIPEVTLLIEEISGFDFLYFHSTLLSIEPAKIRDKIYELSDLIFEDNKVLHDQISTYSLGMKRRLEICASLINSPDILIFDEPFNSLDPVFCNLFIKILKRLMDLRKTILISSHDLTYVQEVSTHIALISNGRINYFGKKEEFFTNNQSTLDSFFKYLPNNISENEAKKIPNWL